MSTVKDDLILALEHTRDVVHRTYCTHTASGVKVGCWKECTEAADALNRARAEPEGKCASEGHLLPCDSSCSCFQAGLEAQRERVGGGRA